MSNCEKWLLAYMTKNPFVIAQTAMSEGKKQGYKKHEIKEAKKIIGVRTIHQNEVPGVENNWYWVKD